jgi:hypothetical protein
LLYISPGSLYNHCVILQDSAPHGWCVILFQASSHITNYSNAFSATRLSSYIGALYTQLRNAHSRTALKNKQPAPASTSLLESKHGLAVIQHVVPLPPATCESSSLWRNPCMSRYQPGHEGHDPYIDYTPQAEDHPEGRVYGSHVEDIHHDGPQDLNQLHELGGQQQPQLPLHQQIPQQHQHHAQHQVLMSPHEIAHHQMPQFGAGQGMLPYGTRQIQSASGTKRQRDELGLDIGGLPGEQMQGDDLQRMSSQMSQQSMVGVGYGGQPVQEYHAHTLPNQGHPSKIPRTGEGESSMMTQGAPSMVGMEGMPPPAPRPRGPKLKFTPEDDQLLIDLKENRSLTWKQIAEFFPGRSSGTLQVRYCTKLKAKSTQWTEETVSLSPAWAFCLYLMFLPDHETPHGFTRL